MEALLLGVTLVSLSLAIAMSAVAWKLLHTEKQRSSARIDALRAMAMTPAPAVVEPDAQLPTIREDIPADALARSDTWELPLQMPPVSAAERSQRPAVGIAREQIMTLDRHGLHDGPMFDRATEEVGLPGRRWLVLAAVALLMAAGVATVSALRSPEIVAAVAVSREEAAAGAAALRPLELLSLRHAVGPGGTFNVVGLVQNPSGGEPLDHLVAVVYLFDDQGHYFASGRANLEQSAFPAGDGSPFSVRIANVTGVSRYRVGFRRQDGTVVQHVDRRGQLPAGMTDSATDDGLEPDFAPQDVHAAELGVPTAR